FIDDTLKKAGIQTDFIEIDEDTRINVKLKTGDETEINAPGPNISQTQFENLLRQLKQTSKKDIVVVAGSIPKSVPKDAYEQIAYIIKQSGARVDVDAEKDLLESVLKLISLFNEPNKCELEVMFDTSLNADVDVIHYAQEIMKLGASSVLVSLG